MHFCTILHMKQGKQGSTGTSLLVMKGSVTTKLSQHQHFAEFLYVKQMEVWWSVDSVAPSVSNLKCNPSIVSNSVMESLFF